jgi:hypothetical protein
MIPGFAIAEAVQYDEDYGFRTIQLQSIISLSVFARLPGNSSLVVPPQQKNQNALMAAFAGRKGPRNKYLRITMDLKTARHTFRQREDEVLF